MGGKPRWYADEVRLGLLMAVVICSAGPRPVAAQPSIPATFFGTVLVSGGPPPVGLRVRGFVGGVDCTQDDSGRVQVDGAQAVYVLVVVHESQRPGCGADGREVTFTVGGVAAEQRVRWRPEPQAADIDVRPAPGATLVVEATSTPVDARETPPDGLSPSAPVADDGADVARLVLLGAVIAVAIGIAAAVASGRRRKERRKEKEKT